ncbi:MAG: glycosyltransferase family 39 protein [Gammaproteobacteria bacterium]|nr:glycosyltransferase family 39 protein [Gammaproteobacteria bacterium]
MESSLSPQLRQRLYLIMAVLALLRVIAMTWFPLTDATEARYAEIARKMLETGNWVTPQYDYGVPFWAKPPLSTWLSAGSMAIFGVNEFAARLPALVLSIGVIALIYGWIKQHRGADQALITAIILATCAMFFAGSGTVMTDTSLAFATTLSMIAFWQAYQTKSHVWGYLFFIGQGIGLLAKGPLVLVLSLMPIGLWLIWKRDLLLFFRVLPWISGTLLMLVIAAPWYWLAETRTPGFLNYFLVGEHFYRFVDSGWQGDLYGHAHAQPHGTILIYWLLGAMPWSLAALYWLIRRYKSVLQEWRQSEWLVYLGLWAVAALVFFSLASNVIPPYILPMLPAFAVLLVELAWGYYMSRGSIAWKRWGVVGLIFPMILVIASVAAGQNPTYSYVDTQKPVVEAYLRDRPNTDSRLIYVGDRYYSAEFYTGGKAQHWPWPSDWNDLRQQTINDVLVINADAFTGVRMQFPAESYRTIVIKDVVVVEKLPAKI